MASLGRLLANLRNTFYLTAIRNYQKYQYSTQIGRLKYVKWLDKPIIRLHTKMKPFYLSLSKNRINAVCLSAVAFGALVPVLCAAGTDTECKPITECIFIPILSSYGLVITNTFCTYRMMQSLIILHTHTHTHTTGITRGSSVF